MSDEPACRGSGKSSQAARSSTEKRPVLASYRTGIPNGRHYVADGRRKAPHADEDGLIHSGAGATRSQRNEDQRVAEPHRGIKAPTTSRAERACATDAFDRNCFTRLGTIPAPECVR